MMLMQCISLLAVLRRYLCKLQVPDISGYRCLCYFKPFLVQIFCQFFLRFNMIFVDQFYDLRMSVYFPLINFPSSFSVIFPKNWFYWSSLSLSSFPPYRLSAYPRSGSAHWSHRQTWPVLFRYFLFVLPRSQLRSHRLKTEQYFLYSTHESRLVWSR